MKDLNPHNNTKWEQPKWDKIPGLNEDRQDFKLLKNKPTSGFTFFAMDIWSSAGSTGDGTYREVNLIGANGDMETSYSQEIVVGRGSTTAKITKRYTATVSGNLITIPAGGVVNIVANFYNATQFIRLTKTGGSLRWLRGSSLDMNNTNNDITFINSSTSDSTLLIKFGTSASDRPIFGINISIL